MNICAVIVTFNRKNLLKKVFEAFDNVDAPPNSIVIVDNNSTDGTDNIISQWKATTEFKEVHYVHLSKNIGGSGGFYEGIRYAMTLNPDWIWVSDDDAIPDKDAFRILRAKIASLGNNKNYYSALCCSVINNGYIDGYHRRKLIHKTLFVQGQGINPKEYLDKQELELDLFSFVGALINVDTIKKVGLPERDYFIWFDDTEYSWRLSLCGKIICLTNAKIYHDTDNISNQLTWKTFYGIRNSLLMYKKHHYPTYLKYLLSYSATTFNYCFINRNKIARNMMASAIFDAILSRQGLHPTYKPGWKNE